MDGFVVSLTAEASVVVVVVVVVCVVSVVVEKVFDLLVNNDCGVVSLVFGVVFLMDRFLFVRVRLEMRVVVLVAFCCLWEARCI